MIDSDPIRYREIAPASGLAHLIECFWTLRGSAVAPSGRRRILPDGCSDVIFDFGGATRVSGRSRPNRYVVGTMTRPLQVEHEGAVDLLGVRFRPGGASGLIAVPAHELLDTWTELDALWGAGSVELWERMAAMEEPRARVTLLQRRLTEWSRRADGPTDRVTLRAAALLSGGGGLPDDGPPRGGAARSSSVADVASALGVSRRHLERRFLEHVGLPPGEFRRVTRLRRAADLVLAGSGSLSEVALRAGYHDQAHMTRDFSTLAGVTPGRYRREVRGSAPPVASVQDADAGERHHGKDRVRSTPPNRGSPP